MGGSLRAILLGLVLVGCSQDPITVGDSGDFGTVVFQQVATKTLTLTNPGGEVTGLAGTVESPFAFAGGTFPGTGGTCASVLAESASCTVVVSFTSAANGSAEKVLQFTYASGSTALTTDVVLMATVDNGTFNRSSMFNNIVYSVTPLGGTTGSLYLGGSFTSYNGTSASRFIKLNFDSSVDTTFQTSTGFDNTVFDSVLESSGNGVYVGGNFTSYRGTSVNRFLRLKSDGSMDTGFAFGTGFNGIVNTVASSGSDGGVYVGGVFSSYNGTTANRLVKLKSDGTIDSSFPTGTGFNGTVSAISAPDSVTGDIVVAGFFNTYDGASAVRVVRLQSNGTRRSTFSSGTGFDAAPTDLVFAGDGSGDVYVSGGFVTYNGTTVNGMARLNSDGSLDTAFAVGTAAGGSSVSAVGLTASGGTLWSGAFTSFNGTSNINRIVALKADGSVDSSFALGTGLDAQANAIRLAGDGTNDLYLAGSFTNYGGTAAGYLMRISELGALE